MVVPVVFLGCEALYIYNDMTYIYIYIWHMPKTCRGTLAHPLSTCTYGVRCMLYITSHWTFAPHVRAYPPPTTLAYPPPPVPTCTFSVQ